MLCKINDLVLASVHHQRLFGVDATFTNDSKRKPVVIFIHGFKGFKDWGHFNLIADAFAQADMVFIKLNLSHNGTALDFPEDFADLEAFGHNNFSIELDDVGVLIDYLFSANCVIPSTEIDLQRLYLIGHSRGGGVGGFHPFHSFVLPEHSQAIVENTVKFFKQS
ncbi:MAG: hypothetical protein V4714_01515 [Bacteroidota bacterium]